MTKLIVAFRSFAKQPNKGVKQAKKQGVVTVKQATNRELARFEVLTGALMQIQALWDVTNTNAAWQPNCGPSLPYFCDVTPCKLEKVWKCSVFISGCTRGNAILRNFHKN